MCKKIAQHWRIPTLHCSWGLGTLQGVALNSLEVGAIEKGHINAPDHRQCRQEVLKRVLATPVVFSHFFHLFPVAGVALGWSPFIPGGALLLGGHKRQLTVFAHCFMFVAIVSEN